MSAGYQYPQHGMFHVDSRPLPPAIELRDYIAAQALPAVIAIEADGTAEQGAKQLGLEVGEYNPQVHFPIICANAAYRLADAMLKAREAKS